MRRAPSVAHRVVVLASSCHNLVMVCVTTCVHRAHRVHRDRMRVVGVLAR
jgi:hypothetical protein